MEIGMFLAIVGVVVLAIVLVVILISLAGAAGNFNGIVEGFTLIMDNFTEICTKLADWWNGVVVAITNSWQGIVDFFEAIISFFS